jgi:glutamyl-tRNA(Gln) amidotransferase subunit D
MIPEVAYIKLAWALGCHPDDPDAVRELMVTPIAGEITEGEPHDGYLLFQGGVPEMKDFLSKIWS